MAGFPPSNRRSVSLAPVREGAPDKTKSDQFASRTKLRLEASLTGMGLKDWFLGASLLVKDCMDDIEPESPSLQKMLESVHSAAQVLDDENWRRYNELICSRIHCQDYEVFGALFAETEPSWQSLLTGPRSGSVCVFLHIGTEPPSGNLCDLLTKLGWFGVSISPVKMSPGYDDLIEHHHLDPSHEKDRDQFIALTSEAGGKVPKPAHFALAFVNTVFNPADPEPDSDEELAVSGSALHGRQGAACAGDDGRDACGLTSEGAQDVDNAPVTRSGPEARASRPLNLEDADRTAQCSTASGYGKLGITRYPSVRKRLRALNTSLSVALNRLEQNGSLVIMWPGLACHPVLFFLTSYLRNLFMRVHVLASEGARSFEVYILCAVFNREKANDATPGEGGTAIKSFLGCAYRRAALDDVLLWTLTASMEREEAFFGVDGKSKSRTYDELWTLMAAKYKALASELDVDVSKVTKSGRERKERKQKPEPKSEESKGKKVDKDSSKGVQSSTVQGSASAEASAKLTKAALVKDLPGAEGKAKPSQRVKKRTLGSTAQIKLQPAAISKAQQGDAARPVSGNPESSDESGAEEHLRASATSLCSHGERDTGIRRFSMASTDKAPRKATVEETALQHGTFKPGALCAEHKVRKWHRPRPDVGVSLVGDELSGASACTG